MSSASPPGHWLFGHARLFRRDPLGYATILARTCGDRVPLRFLTRRALLISHPQGIGEVQVGKSRSFRKHFALRLARPALGDGLLISEGSTWTQHRQIVQPAFRKEAIASYAPIMVEHATRLVDHWQDGQTLDVHLQMIDVTARIVTQCLFGTELGAGADEAHAAMAILTESFKSRLDALVHLPLILPTPANRRFRRAMAGIDGVLGRIISQRRQGPPRPDVLSALLQAARPDGTPALDDRAIRDEVATLFLAGHETTANALSWTHWLLARHPDCQARLERELDETLAGRPPSLADLPQLPYCRQVIEESMRLMPPAWIIGREALVPVEIAGALVQRGTTVLMSPWVVHRDRRWFAEPERFLPERWGDGLAERLPDFAYFPFGGGARSCIGAGFARMEMALLLACMASRFRMTLAPGARIEALPTITLRPRWGMPMVLQARSSPVPTIPPPQLRPNAPARLAT